MILALRFSRYTTAKPSESAFSTVILNFDNCQPEVVGDVMPGRDVQFVGLDISANFGDSRLKPITSDQKYS